ncbi:hypothetical protein ABTY61_00900 [Kitasatospora sp. NPDC096128]|uniref:hypothetical protein n=1 Tax=Kitasatospora sp. NPDC096128 TaxID=3155547 RepID=UPI003329E965
MIRIGCSGHQNLTAGTRRVVARAVAAQIAEVTDDEFVGLSCLAEGTDQLFAFAVLAAGGRLHAVLPSHELERSFRSAEALTRYRALLDLSTDVRTLPFAEPGEDAYLAAGYEVVDRCDLLLAVWDGQPAGGKGGTADAVAYARRKGVAVHVIWPSGARRA